MATESFSHRLNGRFDGMIRLADVEKLGAAMALSDGWYLVDPESSLPDATVNGTTASQHLQQLVEEILREERGIWTTMVYVQSMEDPHIVKVFHPKRAGCGCGPSMGVKPWWVMTRVPPEPVAAWQQVACAPKKKFWFS
ncbi:MAG: hypothetical protein G8345_03955 [Magnetococcales bacterium]|nr:hypothetical protein [Magnetococcales bacterium]